MKEVELDGKWQRVVLSQTIDAYRTGWAGVWDAFVAAVRGRPQFTVLRPLTVSIVMKGDAGNRAELIVSTGYAELGPQPVTETKE